MKFSYKLGNKEIVEILIEVGADVNTKHKAGGTALHIAAYLHEKIVEHLLAHGANVNKKDIDGATPVVCG